MKRLSLILFFIGQILTAQQGGMWIPSLLEGLNEKEMMQLGSKLTAKDIYDINNSSLKDAVIHCPRSAWKGLPPSKSLYHQPKGRGIAIGNLTSQLLSNIYLDQLDRFVTLELGFKHYGRYVDDFYIIAPDKAELVEVTMTVEQYVNHSLGLVLHPHKKHLQECNRGVAFLGAVIYPHRIHPGKRLKRNLMAALSNPDCPETTEASYRGLVKHYRHRKLLAGVKVRGGVQ